MQPSTSIQKRVEKAVDHYMDLATLHYKRPFVRPKIFYTSSTAVCGTQGGIAYGYLPKNVFHILFNTSLINRNTKEFIATLVPHELAHIICFQLYGTLYTTYAYAHGQVWKDVMNLFGAPTTARHNFKTNGVKSYDPKKFVQEVHEFLKEDLDPVYIRRALETITGYKLKTIDRILASR